MPSQDILRMGTEIDTFSDSEEFGSDCPSKNRGKNRGAETKIKLKKLRSIKLSGLPGLKSFKRRSVLQRDGVFADILFTDASNSEQSTTTEVSDGLSNHNGSTSSCCSTKDSMQTPEQTLTSRSNLKLRKPLMPKSSEGSEMRKKQMTLRSTKFTYSVSSTTGDTKSQDDQDSPLAYSACSSSVNKNGSQASPSDFDSSSCSNDLHMMHLQSLSTSSTVSKRKLIRKFSIKPERNSIRMKAKKAPLRKTITPAHPDSSIDRATCSSILKVSTGANKHKLEGVENVCEELSTGKVCTYSYCFLHGNRRATEPSLKRFSSMRRRRQKDLKNLRPESSTLAGAKIPVNINQTRGKLWKQDCAINETVNTSTKISDVIQKMGSDFTVETCAKPKVQTKEIGIQTEDIDFSDNENLARIPTSQVSKSSSKQSHTLVMYPVMVDSRMESSHPGMKLDDALTEAMSTEQKDEHTDALSPGKECKSILPCDKVAPSDHCLSAPPENLSSPAMLCLNSNDAIGKCYRRVPVDEKSLLIAKGSSTGTDSDDYCFGLTRNLLQTKVLIDVNEAPYRSESLKTEESVGAKPSIARVGFKSSGDPLEKAVSKKEDKGTESELESSQRHSTLEIPEPDSRVDVVHTGLVKKNSGLWNLIYQNMVSQLPITNETNLQLHGEEDIERQERNGTMVLEANNVVFSQRDSEADQSSGVDDEDAGLQKVELTQSDAIKLVQEALNNILLMEIQGHTSDDHSKTNNIHLHQNLQEVNEEKCLEPNVSTSDIAVKEISADDSSSAEDCRTSSILKNKPTRQLSKSWSSVRKIFLLRRFVKTLDRIRNFSPRTPRNSPMQLSPGSEKVYPRHQTIEERRNSEEWMLDYALQLVISKLAPAQKRRVELLVKAYETVLAQPAKTESNRNTRTAPSSYADFVQSCNDSVVRASCETVETINTRTLAITSCQKEDTSACEVTDTGRVREPGFAKIVSGSRFHGHGVIRTARGKEILEEKDVILEVPKDITLTTNSEFHNTALELNSMNEVIDKTSIHEERLIAGNNAKSTEADMPLSSGPVSDCEGKAAAIEHIDRKAAPECMLLEGPPGAKQHAESYIHTSNIVDDTQMEKKKQMKLWFMVYRRMLSGLSVEESTEKLLNDTATEKQEDNKNFGSENHEHCQRMEPYQTEAIKLVEEAIDRIVLTDSEDQLSDNQSVASYEASDQELHDNKQSEEESFISTSAGDRFRISEKLNLKSSVVSNTEGTWQPSDEKSEKQDKPVSKLGIKFNQKASNHWNKVRKLMRFIKALDKVKKIYSRQPSHLPSEAEPEAETVNLKHQEVDDWKDSEEWMLDYAMQKAVAKLTPVRKRKVQMIVEAFETVMPTIKTDAH